MAASFIDLMLGLAEQQGHNLGQAAKTRYMENESQAIGPRIDLLQAQAEAARAANEQRAEMAPLEKQLRQAQIMAYLAKAKPEAEQPSSNFGKVMKDYQNTIKLFGPESPQAKQFKDYISTLTNKTGVQVFDPKTGQPLVQIGGSQRNASGGQTYYNPATGEVVSKPTGKVQTAAQQTVASTPALVQGMEEAIGPIKSRLSIGGQLKYAGYSVLNPAFGVGSKFIGDYNTAIDQIPLAAERLMKVNGLNITDQSFNEMKSIMMPRANDSAESYEMRIRKHIVTEKKRQLEAEKILREGFRLPAEGAAGEGVVPQENPQQATEPLAELDDLRNLARGK